LHIIVFARRGFEVNICAIFDLDELYAIVGHTLQRKGSSEIQSFAVKLLDNSSEVWKIGEKSASSASSINLMIQAIITSAALLIFSTSHGKLEVAGRG
jgi:hypothetical protein